MANDEQVAALFGEKSARTRQIMPSESYSTEKTVGRHVRTGQPVMMDGRQLLNPSQLEQAKCPELLRRGVAMFKAWRDRRAAKANRRRATEAEKAIKAECDELRRQLADLQIYTADVEQRLAEAVSKRNVLDFENKTLWLVVTRDRQRVKKELSEYVEQQG